MVEAIPMAVITKEENISSDGTCLLVESIQEFVKSQDIPQPYRNPSDSVRKSPGLRTCAAHLEC
eukprot:m.387023 g.387023  ORF g.387023 m.387023 type:complete len:64 (+) comp16749_c1_seq1:1403-1594(+)